MKIKKLLLLFLSISLLTGCDAIGGFFNPTNSSDISSEVSSQSEQTIENNLVKIKSISVNEKNNTQLKARVRNQKGNENSNFTVITKEQSDVQFTITLDNPEAFGIDALRIYCDDINAQIQVEGEWKKIAQENDGTRVVNWSSEDPYEKTYNIRTTSLVDLVSFKVVDIRLAGHETFLSKQSKSTDFGNNELLIYKMDTDAYDLDIVSNSFKRIKFGIKIKENVTNLSNFRVNGEEANSEGYWEIIKEEENIEVSYDFELVNGIKLNRKDIKYIGPILPKAWNDNETKYRKENCNVVLSPKNDNQKSAKDCMNSEDILYIDLRNDEEGRQKGYIKGFTSVSYFRYLVGEEGQLFTRQLTDDSVIYIPNYDYSIDRIYELFPKDTPMFVMCQSGGRVLYFIELLDQLGYDTSMIYNIGGWNDISNLENYGGYEVVIPSIE